jgi:hypothetical protein
MEIARLKLDGSEHCVGIIELRTNGPTFFEAQCDCDWRTQRGDTDLPAVERAAHDHLNSLK